MEKEEKTETKNLWKTETEKQTIFSAKKRVSGLEIKE